MPLPPPPPIAFITTEEFFFKSLKKLDACFKDVFPCVPLTTGISNLRANFFASDLSPKIVKDFSEGPINFNLACLAAFAKAGFSLKNP